MSVKPSVRPAAVLPAIVLAVTVLACASPALAQGAPRSIGECERLKNDLAYNQCLATFGPEARMITGGDGASGRAPASAAAMAAIPYATEPGQSEVPQVEEPVLATRGNRYTRRTGRQSASFDIGAGAAGTTAYASGGQRSSRSRRRR